MHPNLHRNDWFGTTSIVPTYVLCSFVQLLSGCKISTYSGGWVKVRALWRKRVGIHTL